MAPSVRATTSPLVKAAVAAVVITAGLGGFLVVRQLAPKPRAVVAEPPPLTWVEPEPVAPAPQPAAPLPDQLVHEPVPPPLAAVQVQAPPDEVPVAKLRQDQLEAALGTATDSNRKLQIMRRLNKERPPYARYAVAVMFADPDKAVRLEALRIVEAIDTTNDVLMAKVRAMYLHEQDPEVKAQFDRLVQKFRPQEEAEARAREEATRLEAQALLPQ